MISAVAEMYEIHPQTLRLYEREGLLKPSRTEGNTRLYTDEDLERLEFILNLARDLGVNIAGIAIILQMRERMEEMNRQMQNFVEYVRSEMLTRYQQGAPGKRGRLCHSTGRRRSPRSSPRASCRSAFAGALEHFRNTCRLFERCEGWLFLRKKPLECVVPDYTNSESAIAGILSLCLDPHRAFRMPAGMLIPTSCTVFWGWPFWA